MCGAGDLVHVEMVHRLLQGFEPVDKEEGRRIRIESGQSEDESDLSNSHACKLL
jgi:hypothetical protein